jgi:hypothetical protein
LASSDSVSEVAAVLVEVVASSLTSGEVTAYSAVVFCV